MRGSATARWIDWARAERAASDLLWIHGASVGELRAANPVVQRIQRSQPDLQVIYTHTSPSVEAWGREFPVARTDYLPLDDETTIAEVIHEVGPTVIAVSRGDLWPGLLDAARSGGVPVGVIGGEISPSSTRLAWPWRAVFRSLYQDLAFVCANTEDDAGRFARVGTPAGVITVCGDPRVDQVAESITTLAGPGLLGRPRTSLLAGSTEPEDDRILLGAFASLDPASRPTLALVPHSPGDAEIARISEVAAGLGLQCSIASRDPVPGPGAVRLVDEMGVLSGLYAFADLAYVGGGFRNRGLHSVIEPAVFGLPVLFGPNWRGYPWAARLVENGAAFPISSRRPAEDLANRWFELDGDRSGREHAGLRGRAALRSGAARRTAEILLPYLGRERERKQQKMRAPQP